jgi:CheY-like chemotaxis protein
VSKECNRPSETGKIILIVEDEYLVRDWMAEELRAAGCTVLEAMNGTEAIEIILSESQLDVLVTDINLGKGPTGWAVAERFRDHHPQNPVIYASGSRQDDARRVPRSVFLDKPVDVSSLLAICRHAQPGRRSIDFDHSRSPGPMQSSV